MQTSPATTPDAVPSTLGFPRNSQSYIAQARPPAAAAKWVVQNALEARLSDASSLPALKPNQPTHSIAAPSAVYVRLWGRMSSCPKPMRRADQQCADRAPTRRS